MDWTKTGGRKQIGRKVGLPLTAKVHRNGRELDLHVIYIGFVVRYATPPTANSLPYQRHDTASRYRILRKLYEFGFQSNFPKFIEYFLKER